MTAAVSQGTRNRIVLVVGLDLDDTSEHLLRSVRALTRGVDEAELHIVHVVPPETVNERLTEPMASPWSGERGRARIAQWEIERLCQVVDTGTVAHLFVHTPAGRPVPELTRLAREVGADAIVVEAHDQGSEPRRYFHRSVAAGLARTAPCSVLTVRAHHPVAAQPGDPPAAGKA
jgi:nucleotide-binding universal stress UspA family protein